MGTSTTRPAFRKPWEHGAKGYQEADTFAAFAEGMKRKRTVQMVKMPNSGEAGLKPCAGCGIPLRDAYAVNQGGALDHQDEWSTWTYSPKSKQAYGMHYYCSWGHLMQQVLDLGRLVRF